MLGIGLASPCAAREVAKACAVRPISQTARWRLACSTPTTWLVSVAPTAARATASNCCATRTRKLRNQSPTCWFQQLSGVQMAESQTVSSAVFHGPYQTKHEHTLDGN